MSESFSAIQIPQTPDGEDCWLSILLVRDGQAVEAGQTLGRLEMNSSPFELVSPANGYVVGLRALSGQMIQPGQVLCYICERPSIPSSPRAVSQTRTVAGDPTAVLIFGGGGHGKAVIDLVRSQGIYRITGIIDDGLPVGSEVLGVTVLGGAQVLEEWYARGVSLAINAVGGIGHVDVRLKVFDLLSKAGFSCPSIVHPSAVVERSAVLEAGVQILAQSYVGSAARIGFGSVLNAGAILSHDCVLGRVVNLSPGATLAGNVHVDHYTQVGMGATVNLGINIGQRCILGNGCTVKANVPANTRVKAGSVWPVLRTEQESNHVS